MSSLIMQDLSNLVSEYLNNKGNIHSLESQLKHYQSRSLVDAIKSACNKGEYEVNGKICLNSHFYRRKWDALDTAKARLINIADILRQSKDFDALFKQINEKLRPIKDIGSLTIYDIALRIGVALKLSPDKIYLQAGASKGACKLNLLKSARTAIVDYSVVIDTYNELKILAPYQLENFFCVFKSRFRNNSQNKLARKLSRIEKASADLREKRYKKGC